VLESCADDLIYNIPQAYKPGLQKICYNQGRSFAFIFDSEDSAKWFLETTRTVDVQNWQLGCNGFRGNLCLIVEDEIENLFTLETEDRDQWIVVPDYDTLHRYKIARELVGQMAAAAVAR
ncbi:unnamed protein product, partial [Prorocentrum cordatum]